MLVQLSIILLTVWLLVAVLRPVGQPAVIGEMAAGFVLGPVIFGWIAPSGMGGSLPRRAWVRSVAWEPWDWRSSCS